MATKSVTTKTAVKRYGKIILASMVGTFLLNSIANRSAPVAKLRNKVNTGA